MFSFLGAGFRDGLRGAAGVISAPNFSHIVGVFAPILSLLRVESWGELDIGIFKKKYFYDYFP